jgi:hypothetical protein
MEDQRQQRDDLERAAAETREPEQAARIRAEDDEMTDRLQTETEARLGATQETLARTAADIDRNRSELAARDRELRRTREIAQEIHRDAATIEATRIQPADLPDVSSEPRQGR